MTRIKFRNSDGTNEYSCTINPVEVEILDSVDYKVQPVLDGAGIRVVSAFDNRPRKLIWDPFEYGSGSTFSTRFEAMLSELRSYKGTSKELNLQDIETDLSRSWKDIFIDDVTTKVIRGAGYIKLQLTILFRYTEAL